MSALTLSDAGPGGLLALDLWPVDFCPAPASIPYFERDLLAYLNTLGLTVYPGHIPQKASLTAMSFFVVSAEHEHRIGSAAGIAEVHVQIGVSSRSYIDCGQYSERLRVALQGLIQTRMNNGTYVFACLLGNQLTHYDPAVDASDRGVHTKLSEFIFYHQETIPSF